VNADVEQVMKQVRRRTILNIAVANDGQGAARLLAQHPDVEKIEERPKFLVVTLRPDVRDYSPLATLLVQTGYQLTLFREDELNLETAFMALTKGITA
jgi:ABC-2 type transport system ATP-binding protein